MHSYTFINSHSLVGDPGPVSSKIFPHESVFMMELLIYLFIYLFMLTSCVYYFYCCKPKTVERVCHLLE